MTLIDERWTCSHCGHVTDPDVPKNTARAGIQAARDALRKATEETDEP
jgi:hypothetical protein